MLSVNVVSCLATAFLRRLIVRLSTTQPPVPSTPGALSLTNITGILIIGLAYIIIKKMKVTMGYNFHFQPKRGGHSEYSSRVRGGVEKVRLWTKRHFPKSRRIQHSPRNVLVNDNNSLPYCSFSINRGRNSILEQSSVRPYSDNTTTDLLQLPSASETNSQNKIRSPLVRKTRSGRVYGYGGPKG